MFHKRFFVFVHVVQMFNISCLLHVVIIIPCRLSPMALTKNCAWTKIKLYMATDTKNRIQKMEREIQELWRVVSEDIFWHPTVVKEIKKRSIEGRKLLRSGKLKTLEEVIAGR